MTQTEFATLLGVSRLSVSELLHEKRALSPEMSVRIAKLLDTTPESWLRMQEALDLWEVQQEPGRLSAVRPLPKSRLAEVA
jgi:addiction module HigA family antidote